MEGLLGITGTPGTGKETISRIVARKLGFSALDLNAFAEKTMLISGWKGNHLVDTRKLRIELGKKALRNYVIHGHLLPDVFRRDELDFVALLRCDPSVLKKRMLARGYDSRKMIENLEAELIGVTLDSTLRSFERKKIHEYDSSNVGPHELAEAIANDFRSGARQSAPWIDWTLSYDSAAKLRLLFSTRLIRNKGTRYP